MFKKFIYLILMFITIISISSCAVKSDFDQVYDILEDVSLNIDDIYRDALTKKEYNQDNNLESRSSNLYTKDEIQSSWIIDSTEDYYGGSQFAKNVFDYIIENDFASLEEINNYDDKYQVTLLENGYVEIIYTNDEISEQVQVGYQQGNIFNRHKLHVISYKTQTNNTYNRYQEFLEDSHITEIERLEGQIINFYYFDLESKESYRVDLPDEINPTIYYSNYDEGYSLLWQLMNEDVLRYNIVFFKSTSTSTLRYVDYKFSDNITIIYNLANYDGWDKLTVDDSKATIYDENNQVIDFEETDEHNFAYFLINEVAIAQLHKTIPRDTVTNELITLEKYGLIPKDDRITLDFIKDHDDYQRYYDMEFYEDLSLGSLNNDNYKVLIDEAFIEYFE